MKHFLRQTDEVIKWNLRQLVVFVILYWLQVYSILGR